VWLYVVIGWGVVVLDDVLREEGGGMVLGKGLL